MATFNERIQVVIDVVTDKATKGFKDFRTAVGEAEGFSGKFKAGVGSLKGTFGGVLGSTAGLAAGITAMGVGAIKSANQFSELAKRSIDLARATGLSTTEASKWIAVADDFGIQAESLQTGLNRIGKTLDAAAWDKYGIQTRDASGAAKSANDIFLQALDVLGRVGNETERARIGNELFGKGWAGIAPIVGNTRAEYEKMLASVSQGETITSGEASRAEKWRLAQDKLSDATGNLVNAFGNLVVAASPLLDLIGGIVQRVADLVDIAGEGDISKPLFEFGKVAQNAKTDTTKLLNAFMDFAHKSGNARSGLDKTGAVIKEMFNWDDPTGVNLRFDNYKKAIRELAESAPEQAGKVISSLTELVLAAERVGSTELSDRGFTFESVQELAAIAVEAAGGMDALGWSIGGVGDESDTANVALNDTVTNLGGIRTASEEAKIALKALQDQISGRKSFIDLQQQLRDDATKIKELETAFKDSKKTAQDAEDFYLGVASATLDAQGALTDYLSKIDEIPDTIKTEIIAAFDPLNPQKTWNDIQSYFDTHAIQVRTETSRENRSPLNGTPATATTGSTGNTGNLKKVPGQAESVGGFGRNSGGVNITVNAPVGANLAEAGRQVADALRAYYANGGEPV